MIWLGLIAAFVFGCLVNKYILTDRPMDYRKMPRGDARLDGKGQASLAERRDPIGRRWG